MQTLGGKRGVDVEAAEAAELLQSYVAASDETKAAEQLNRLFGEYVTRWCHEAARRTLRNYGVAGADQRDEEFDIAAEVMMHVTGRLQEIRRGDAPPVANLHAYAVTAVRNLCFARIRTRCPKHVQLQNRIRYLLRNDPDFAGWTTSDGEQLAGLPEWSGREDVGEPVVPQRSADVLKDVLKSVFELSRAPLRLSDLVGATAESIGITEPIFSTVDETTHVTQAPETDRLLIQREELRALWKEVIQLPAAQRAALLLNLRDAEGHGVIELIPVTGIASVEELAGMMSLSAEALAEVWADLPLEDVRIAEMLGITRQQVINLRKAGRERLVRRKSSGTGNTRTGLTSEKPGGRLRALFRREKRA